MKKRSKLLLVLVVMFMVLLLCPQKAQAWCWDRPGFWFLDARVKLVPTDVFVTVPTGFWGGWYWYKWDCCTWRPYYGPAWAPVCQCSRPYCPLYCPPYCPRNIVNNYPWRGGYYFWGFLDRLTFKFTFWRPKVVWWWTWYPAVYLDPQGVERGFALEMVTLVNEEQTNLLPLDDDVLNNLEIESHDFSVNGGESMGMFAPDDLIVTVADLPNQYALLLEGNGMLPPDASVYASELEGSDLYQDLLLNSPDPMNDRVIIELAAWDVMEHPLTITGQPAVNECGGSDEITVRLTETSVDPVTLTALPGSTQLQLAHPASGTAMGPGEPLEIPMDHVGLAEETIVIRAVDDNLKESQIHTEMISLSLSNADPALDGKRGAPVEVQITDNECSAPYLQADFDLNCVVNVTDFSIFAIDWLESTEPQLPECIDMDGDGYGDPASCGCPYDEADCDDGDPMVNPGSAEICDGIDNNCDGQIDEGLMVDADGDGFIDEACGGDDCDDADPTVFPGAPEICDGKDNDCDGPVDEDVDMDQDGYYDEACGGDDCDDVNPAVNPGEPEDCQNGIDDDCDDLIDYDDPDCVICGNGMVEPPEECDDGNLIDGDGCSSNCTIEFICGDGFCDPAFENPLTCPEDCALCGNGIVEPPEECDDGNNDDGDGCSANCLIESYCGDQICDPMAGEDVITCPEDCPGNCGDAICNPMFEDPVTCPEDCGSCGDGYCDPATENSTTCPEDCGQFVCSGCPTECYGDLNCNGTVDDEDLDIIAAAFGLCIGDPGYIPCADLDENGCIDMADFGEAMNLYMQPLPPDCGGGMCGDLNCGPGEDPITCPSDCMPGGCNNDGTCDPSWEDPGMCPDCAGGGFCGDAYCDPATEDPANCPEDCLLLDCGDGYCDEQGGEDPGTCPLDCDPFCNGDGTCQSWEDPACPDCSGGFCGDGVLNQDETDIDCGGTICPPCDIGESCADNSDCQSYICYNNVCVEYVCGDGYCDEPMGEDPGTCPQDCDPFCNYDMTCQSWEDPMCDDCGGGGFCGDGYCDPAMEDPMTCPEDCGGGGYCGDGYCDPGEELICLEDCGPGTCGDGFCDPGEELTCPSDCEF